MGATILETVPLYEGGVIRVRTVLADGDRQTIMNHLLLELESKGGAITDHVPSWDSVVERLGAEHLEELMTERVSSEIAGQVVKSLQLKCMFAPRLVQMDRPHGEETGDILAIMDFTLQPHSQLSSADGIRVSRPDPRPVTEEMVDIHIGQMLKAHAHFERTDGPVAEGDFLLVNISTHLNGTPCPELTGEEMTIEMAHGLVPSGFLDGVSGMHVGDRRDFKFTTAGLDGSSNDDDDFQVSLEIIDRQRRVVPELTDRFVASAITDAGTTVAELRVHIRNRLSKREEEKVPVQLGKIADAALAERLDTPVPDHYIERMSREILANLETGLSSQGMTLRQYMDREGLDGSQMQYLLMQQARETLRQGLALDALYAQLGLQLSKEDMQRALSELAPGDEDRARTRSHRNGTWPMVEQLAGRLRAHDWLMENIIVE